MNNKIDNDMEIIEENDEELIYCCPICNAGSIKIYKNSYKKYGYCDVCDATYIHYIPLPQQLDVHNSKAKIKLLLGGMGSAKSETGVMEIIEHALNTPNGRTLMLAQTLKQLGAAIMPKFLAYMPEKYVEKWVDTKNDKSILLTNGHEIIGFASDDEEKFRSLDITAFLLEEASGIRQQVYQELIRRMRHPMGLVKGIPHYVGLVISNPSQGFIRDLLFTSSSIKGSPSIRSTVEKYKDRLTDINQDLEAFLSSSRDNPYLPKGFIESVVRSLSPAQVKLYVDCIIEYAEGAVYPEFLTYLVDGFKIPDHWERYLAHDPGVRDPSAVLLCALDPENRVLYAYKEFYKTDLVLTDVALNIKKMISDIPNGMLRPMLIDPSANQRSKINARTYKQQMNLEHGLIFTDAKNALIDGIFKTRDLMQQGKIKIFRELIMTIKEGCEYRYANEKEINMKKNPGDKPLDKDNHLMDCLRYIVQVLPYNIFEKVTIVDNNSWKASFLVDNKQTKNFEGGFRFR